MTSCQETSRECWRVRRNRMTDGNIHENNRRLDDREDFDALQEVTAELEQAEARIEQLEAELSEQVGWARHMAEDLIAAEAKLAKAGL